ncbi:MAG TPA: IS1595 family transposase [Mucilaginibacter sp.]|nr:IS1595 family transposase [Mucilaginibacter sp.]
MLQGQGFKTIYDLVHRFPDEKSCHTYLASRRWCDGEVSCPYEDCTCNKVYVFKDGIRYKCKNCGRIFTAKTRTIFEGSNLPLIKWFIAMHLIMHKKGISSVQLAKDIGTTQRTAWFLLQRIRHTLGMDVKNVKLSGTVEIDETFVGGKNKNRHRNKRVKNSQGRSYKDKAPVFGMKQRNGLVKAMVVNSVNSEDLYRAVAENVEKGTDIMSDEWRAYTALDKEFNRSFVEHGRGNYVNGNVSTNGIENFWSHLKRSIIGIYHQVSRKHLNRYVDESVFRYNNRNLDAQSQIDAILANSECRLKYNELVT